MGGTVEKAVKKTANVLTLGTYDKAKDYLDPDLPELPNEGKPGVAPIPDDLAQKAAIRRKTAVRAKAGRAGTMLTESAKLG